MLVGYSSYFKGFKHMLLLMACIVTMAVLYLKGPTTQHCTSELPIIPETRSSHITPREKPLMQLDVITTFPAYFDTQSRFNFLGNITEERKKERMNEYIVCLKRKLNHRYVSKVHLLYDQDDLPSFINSQLDSELKQKLLLQKVNDSVSYLTSFTYVYANLQERLVMIETGDTYPGEGLDLLNKDFIREKRLMYAVTRRGQLEEFCDMRDIKKFSSSNSCSKAQYHGSHDAYIFVPSQKLTPNVAKYLKGKTYYHYGGDNFTIWFFRTILKHKVINPCKVIHIFHFHCSFVRNHDHQVRVDTNETKHRAYPTNKLS